MPAFAAIIPPMDAPNAPQPDLAAWRARVERDLKGADFDRRLLKTTDDGLTLKPLYTTTDATSNTPRAGGGWTPLSCPRVADPRLANAHAQADLARGAEALLLDLQHVDVQDAADLAAALDGIDAPVHLIGGHLLHALAAPHAASLGLDPIGRLARTGSLSADAVSLAAQRAPDAPGAVFEVDTRVYHAAGAGLAQSLGYALATGIAYLRALEAAGCSLDAAAGAIGFTLPVEVRFFESIAAMRALRVTWARILEASGARVTTSRVRAWPAERQFTRRDPAVNLLRNTAACFAGAVGGADQVVSLPYDLALGEATERSRRIARNTQTILARESHLGAVVDPAGGSGFIEALTTDIAAHAWQIMQDTEAGGGMIAGLVTRRVHAAIHATAQRRDRRIATRKRALVGISAFADTDALIDRPASATDLAAWRATRSWPTVEIEPGDIAAARTAIAQGVPFEGLLRQLDDATRVGTQALPMHREAASFEALRDRADALTPRPQVFLANLGAIPRHIARATFATQLFQAGGLEVIGNDGFPDHAALVAAFTASGATTACICGHEGDYDTQADAVVKALRSAGARQILVAGRPRELADIDAWVHLGCDALAVLDGLITPRS